ncbi:MAG TPA: hypothetical protein VKA69_00390 [Desulfobacteria bacterium]|nr:hypothetical protein [Desulfobacteria bacterium]
MKKLFIIGIAALLLVAFSVPAMAKVKMGGIIFTDFYYLDRDANNSAAWGTGADDYQVTTIQVPNITRLYGRWTNEDNVGMYIEFGVGQTSGAVNGNTSSGVALRHAYGWWDVNPNFQIMAGKSTTPFSPLNPSQLLGTRSGTVNIIGVGYGDFYSGRFAQVRGTFKFGKMGRVELALVDPNGGQRYGGGSPLVPLGAGTNYYPIDIYGAVDGVDYQTNTKLPRFDLSVPLYFGPIALYPGFLYQYRTVDILNPAYSRFDDSIHSYIGTLGVKGGFGPFGFAAEGNWGRNWGNTRGLFGTSGPASIASALPNPDGQINNATTYSYWFDVWYKIGPVTPHAMFGQMNTNVDLDYQELNATSTMWGFSIPIDLAKGFRVRPELMWYDDGELQYGGTDFADFGKYAIYGVQFQITF